MGVGNLLGEYLNPFPGSKVTNARLRPALKMLINSGLQKYRKNLSQGSFESDSQSPLVKQLELFLRAHVFDCMPIRLLALPAMQLIEREEIINHISKELAHWKSEKKIQLMLDTVNELSEIETRGPEDSEEDVREDPAKAIFDFLISEFGGYAILSHTWLHGRGSEITYQDTLAKEWQSQYENSSESHAGYQKIKEFCNVAHKLGVTLAWVDTICINKDSSAELDESIRSMYRWYQGSTICLTYLHQTSPKEPIQPDTTFTISNPFRDTKEFPYAESMNKDRWFTRGWTLQELLAPKQLKFYDCHWKSICLGTNDKGDRNIQNLVSAVTGISSKDLVSFDPLNTASSVIERMAWAAKRTTTRGEDSAYSLMGIFGVSIPTSYGEGAERAFFRLIEAIITSRNISQILQVLAWGGKPISNIIHLSRLIPSSPECYLHRFLVQGNVSTHKLTSIDDIVQACGLFPLTGEAMILTHLGLRVRLLLVLTRPLRLFTSGSSKTRWGHEVGPWKVALSCTNILDNSLNAPDIKIGLKKMQPYQPKEDNFGSICETGGAHKFVFGIFTFREDRTDIVIPPCSFGFLLAISTSNVDNFSMESLSPEAFEPNWKIDTHEVIRIHNGKRNNKHVKKSNYRDTMKVMTVNL